MAEFAELLTGFEASLPADIERPALLSQHALRPRPDKRRARDGLPWPASCRTLIFSSGGRSTFRVTVGMSSFRIRTKVS